MSRFYFIRPLSEAKNHCLATISTFTPSKSVKRSRSPYFGGFVVDVADARLLKDLDGYVFGVEDLEGGNGLVKVHRSQIFASKQEAEDALDQCDQKLMLPTVTHDPFNLF
jgi:hypothetical protein